MLAISWSIGREYVLYHRWPEPRNLGFHILFLAMATAAILFRREWLHQLLAWSMAGAFLAYIIALFARL